MQHEIKRMTTMIARDIEDRIKALQGKGKAIVIIGARQVGKSTILHHLYDGKQGVLWLNGDEQDTVNLLENTSSTRLNAIIGRSKTVIIDEAQKIPDIGRKLKLITDNITGVQLIATGSSSFELSNKLNEPLTGRKRELKMHPLTFAEMVRHTNLLEEKRMIPHRLLYGYYPEVVTSKGDERTVLKELSESYLYRDILAIEGINKPDKLQKLLQALAMQIGEQVSYREIGLLVGLDSKTVEKYIDLLEKSLVIFRLGSFARNLRNELKQSRKVYFWDLGIRNAVIGNFANIESRLDIGGMWENFVIAERMKKKLSENSFCQHYFWRTQQQKEIDLIEEEDGAIRAYEFKWNPKKACINAPQQFSTSYPDAAFYVITRDNVEDIIL